MSNFRKYGTGRGGGVSNFFNSRRDRGTFFRGFRGRGFNSFRPRFFRSNYGNAGNSRYRPDPNEAVVQIRRDPGVPEHSAENTLAQGGASLGNSTYLQNSSRGFHNGRGNSASVNATPNINSDLHHVHPYPRAPTTFEHSPLNGGIPRQVAYHHHSQWRDPEHVTILGGEDLAITETNDSSFQEMVQTCIANFKASGKYDDIRRACLLDVDTKPAFLNAKEKVHDITQRFLDSAQFRPGMDRAKNRESLKKSFEMSRSYQGVLESLVTQILIPKVKTMLRPSVEAEVRRMLDGSQSDQIAPEEPPQQDDGKVKSFISVDTKEIVDEWKLGTSFQTHPAGSFSLPSTSSRFIQQGNGNEGALAQTQVEELPKPVMVVPAAYTFGSVHAQTTCASALMEVGPSKEDKAKNAQVDPSKLLLVKKSIEGEKMSVDEELTMTGDRLEEIQENVDKHFASTQVESKAAEANSAHRAESMDHKETYVAFEEIKEKVEKDIDQAENRDLRSACDLGEAETLNGSGATYETDSEDESPAFEALGEISPVRIDLEADPELLASFYEDKVAELNEPGHQRISYGGLGQGVKFLTPSDLPHQSQKINYHKRFQTLSNRWTNTL